VAVHGRDEAALETTLAGIHREIAGDFMSVTGDVLRRR
jgi:hypothetical protein